MSSSIISMLDLHKACRHDGIAVIVLRKCAPEVAPVLSKLNNRCLLLRSIDRPNCCVPLFDNVLDALINSELFKNNTSQRILS